MSNLFELNPEQLELTNALTQVITKQIGDSYIPFSKYMNLALYHSQYGYYKNMLYKFGGQGDFITAPLVSGLFGNTVSRQIQEVFSHDVDTNILEFGAGNGQLMLDILASIGREIKHYYIVELSASLESLQRKCLIEKMPEYQNRVTWLSDFPKDFNGVILANEVLDAITCDIVHWKNGEIFSKVVTTEDKKFVFTDIKANDQILEMAQNIRVNSDDYTSEISFDRLGFIKSLSEVLKKGMILLIDYGYGEAEHYSLSKSSGTLRGFFRHHLLDDVLLYPGLIDITSSVDYTSIAKAGINNDLDLLGYTTQASFLINCGILTELEKKQKNVSEAEYLQLTNGLNRLVSPNEMGEVFKVMAFGKNLDCADFVGFTKNDKTYTL